MARPRVFKTPEEMDIAVDEYLKACVKAEEPVTLTGMILSMGLSSRQSLDRYQEYDGFSDSVKRAKLIVENSYELSLRSNGRASDIFALKNFGWKDKTEQDIRHTLNHEDALDDLA